MANSIAVRFTDETYATRKQMMEALRTRLIDDVYRLTEAYRRSNCVRMNLKTITQVPFSITQTPALVAKFSAFEAKLTRFSLEYGKLSSDIDNKEKEDRDAFFPILQAAAILSEKKVSDVAVKAMISGIYREGNPEEAATFNYLKSLKTFQREYREAPGEDLLAKYYSILLSTDELISFYRYVDFESLKNAAVLDRQYVGAPGEKVNEMMDGLWNYLSSPSQVFIKALTALYFIHYVKPFDEHNDLLACLLGKSILAEGNLAEAAAILPLEKLLVPSETLTDISNSIERSGDITFFIVYAMDMLLPLLDKLLDDFVSVKNASYLKEFNALPEEKPEEKKPEPKPEPVPVPVDVPPRVEPKPVETIGGKTTLPPTAKLTELPASEDQAAFVVPKRLFSTDKEIKEAARYILESNPNIRRAQALFYASHCTIGRYYSIQDFKKHAKCAYETARTSMDNLAKEGFYQKLQVKNKYVYTPIKQGE